MLSNDDDMVVVVVVVVSFFLIPINKKCKKKDFVKKQKGYDTPVE